MNYAIIYQIIYDVQLTKKELKTSLDNKRLLAYDKELNNLNNDRDCRISVEANSINENR